MIKDDLLKVLGIIVLSAVAGYIFLPSLVFNLPFILIFALIFFPIASAKYNREKMDYSVTGFTVSSTHAFITVYWNAENKTKSDQAVNPIVSAYQNKVMLKRLDASQDVVTLTRMRRCKPTVTTLVPKGPFLKSSSLASEFPLSR